MKFERITKEAPMTTMYRAATYPLLLAFMTVALVGGVAPARAGDGFLSNVNIPKLIGTIVGGVIGIALLSTFMPSFGVLGVIGGAFLGGIVGRWVAGRIAGDDGFDVTSAVRDAWDGVKDRASDVGGWFGDRYDGVRDYFDDKFGKPAPVPSVPANPVDTKDLGALRTEFLEAQLALQQAMVGSDDAAKKAARERYELAYQNYFVARGAVVGK